METSSPARWTLPVPLLRVVAVSPGGVISAD
jgi:hypothetical protein